MLLLWYIILGERQQKHFISSYFNAWTCYLLLQWAHHNAPFRNKRQISPIFQDGVTDLLVYWRGWVLSKAMRGSKEALHGSSKEISVTDLVPQKSGLQCFFINYPISLLMKTHLLMLLVPLLKNSFQSPLMKIQIWEVKKMGKLGAIENNYREALILFNDIIFSQTCAWKISLGLMYCHYLKLNDVHIFTRKKRQLNGFD